MTGYKSKRLAALDEDGFFLVHKTETNKMKVEEIIDYAWPCMCAETALKKAHQAMLAKDYDKAIEATHEAIGDCKAMLESIRAIRKIAAH